MNQREVVLGTLASTPEADFSPVQVQKLFFLLDENIPNHIGGPVFSFTPYDYGPFDQNVYHVLSQLAQDGLVSVIDVPGQEWKKYQITGTGMAMGQGLLGQLPGPIQDYIRNISNYVRSLSFTQLVSAIYRQYPEMKANSVFNK